ncbi:MAG: hypothetical protein V2A71_00130, partial [Candidatus Eisenbacteria bacterium]
MKREVTGLLATVLAIVCLARCAGGQEAPVFASRKTAANSRIVTWTFPQAVDTIALPDRNIFVGSEVITIAGAPLQRGAYFLDFRRGLVVLERPLPPRTELRIEYKFLPFVLKDAYFLRRAWAPSFSGAEQGAAESSAAAPAAGSLVPARSASGLKLRGVKTFSVELGSNRDATLKQSLDMHVSGQVTKGVEMTAVLTDRDLPIQPDGRTESLSELDEIRIELRSQSFNASLGDCNLLLDNSRLVNVSRRLEGATASGRVRGADVVLAGSTLRGKWTSREFLGTEGKQGPYQLTSDGGSPCVVVAGSERVLLDGVRLQRGEGGDYWVDYNSGRLYFTNRRPITAHTRVSVEYEYAFGDYQKGFYAAGAGAGLLGKRGRIDFLYVSESDDKSRGTVGLGDAEREFLKQAGDVPAGGSTGGAVYVGPGNGDYELVSGDSTGSGFFRFVADRKGAYAVSFVNMGAGRGSYFASADTAGKVYYTYAGAGNADYVPARSLVAPTSKTVEDLRASLSVAGLDFTGELALSQTDLNTFSSRDDSDNLGRAGLLSVRMNARGVGFGERSLGLLAADASATLIEKSFGTFGNLHQAFDHENWAMADSAFSKEGQRRLELGAQYSPVRNFSLSARHGELVSSSGTRARRDVYSSELTGRVWAVGKIERATSSGGEDASGRTRTLSSLSARLAGWKVVPSVAYSSEVREVGSSAPEAAGQGPGALRADEI